MNKYQYVCENYKKPKPILFNTEMVRAILENRKTQTRRLIKPQPKYYQKPNGYKVNGKFWFEDKRYKMVDEYYDSYYANPPYQAGDILYVRETWKAISAEPYEHEILIHYQADDFEQNIKFLPVKRYYQFEKYLKKNGNHANIFMPKEAARIFLKVTDVRVERLQDITEKEIITEGFRDTLDGDIFTSAGMHFMATWDDMYKSKGYGWEEDPFVWIIEFEKMNIEKS